MPPAAALDVLADLEVAHEELKVAEEEVRVQQEQIEALLSRYESERRWLSQLSGLVPVALAQTDGAGKLLDANPALAALLHVPLPRLAGKPLRSEERRVGKECRSRWSAYHYKKRRPAHN